MALSAKTLGIIVDSNLNLKEHAKETESKTLKSITLLKYYTGFKWGLNHRSLTLIYKTTVLPKMLYATPVWARAHASKLKNNFVLITVTTRNFIRSRPRYVGFLL